MTFVFVAQDVTSLKHESAGRARATAALRRNPETQVLLKADSAVPYGRVVQAMVILQHAGASKVGFITDPLPAPVHRRG